MSDQGTISTTGRIARTSKVNIDDTRFTVDGVIAEMIIEVDENPDNSEHGTNKELISDNSVLDIGKSFFGINTGNLDISKMAFVQRLGLSTTNQDSDETTTASEPDLRDVSLEDVEEENVLNRKSQQPTAQVHQEQKDNVNSKNVDDASEKHLRNRDVTEQTEKKPDVSTIKKNQPKVVLKQTEKKKPAFTIKKNQPKVVLKQTEKKKPDVSTIKKNQPKVVLKKLPSDSYVGTRAAKQSAVETSSGESELTLGDIVTICDRIMSGDKRQNVRNLFKVMYIQRPPLDLDNIVSRVLQFSGFRFEEGSFPYLKRKKVMKTLSDDALQNMCRILGIKYGSSSEMIDNILKFLLKPSKAPDPSMDIAYQPAVLVKKLDKDAIKAICEKLKQKSKQRGVKGRKTLSGKLSLLKNKSGDLRVTQNTDKVSSVSRKKSEGTLVQKKKVTPTSVSEVLKRKPGRPPKVQIVPEVLKRKPGRPPSLQRKPGPQSSSPQSVPTVAKQKSSRSPRVKFIPEVLKKKPGRPPSLQSKKYKKNLLLKRLQRVPNRNFINKDKYKSQQKKAVLTEKKIPEKHMSLRKGLSVVKKDEDKKITPAPSTSSSSTVKEEEDEKTPAKKITPAKKTPTSSRKRPTSDMQRRSPDKRRRPVHYGDWLNDESTEMFINDVESEPTEAVKSEVVIEDKEISENDELPKDEEVPEDEKIPENEEIPDNEEISESTPIVDNKEPSKEKARGQKLGNFPQIAESLDSITNCVLQRLHVILFGTSLETEVMKKNVLNFDGFPFDRDSEEWQEKHFFLSLSSCINLLEVFEVLHIEISDDSSSALVDTLMNFLLSPRKELLDKSSFVIEDPKKSSSGKDKKTVKKKTEPKKAAATNKKKKGDVKPKPRKVLMDEATVRKLELEIAREQRARRRASLQPTNLFNPRNPAVPASVVAAANLPKPSVAYQIHGAPFQRQILIADDVAPVPPDHKITLGDNAHVKFMIVALNYSDLDILHHLLFLHGAVKSRIRRNILDFDGFPFDETSPRYEVRKAILRRLGYQIVKRLAFILGLASLETVGSLEALINTIMRFLRCPSQVKHVSVKQFPQNFLQDCPQEFDKKTVFANIPNLSHVMREETGSPSLPSGLIVKTVGDAKSKGNALQAKSKSASETVISVAEVVTSDPIKINGIPGTSPRGQNFQVLNPSAQRTLSPLKGQSPAQNVLLQVLPNKPVPAAGSKVQLIPAPVASHHSPQPPPPPLQIGDSSKDDHDEPEEVPTVLPPLVRMPETQVKSPPPIPSLPPGQAFLLDPKKLMVMTKGLNKNSTQLHAVSSLSKTGNQSPSKDSITKKLPLITKIKMPSESQRGVLQQKSLDTQGISLNQSSRHMIISQKSLNKSEQQQISSKPTSSASQTQQIISLPKSLINQSQTQCVVSSKPSSQLVLPQKPLLSQSQPQTCILLKSPPPPPVQVQHLSNTSPKSATSEAKAFILQTSMGSQPVQSTAFQKLSSVSQPQSTMLTTFSVSTSPSLLLVDPSQSFASSSTTDKTVDLAKRLLNLPQFQAMRTPSSDIAEELVLHQKNPNGKDEKITLLRLPPGHPLLPVIEAGKLDCPLNIQPVQAVNTLSHASCSNPTASVPSVPAMLSVKPRESTILSDSGYKSLFSTGLSSNSGVTQQSEKVSHEKPGDKIEVTNLEDPSDDVLFVKIRDIIHAANLEDLTLKKINEKLANEYPGLDISTRRPFIKSTVKNIICGMTSSSS